MRNGFFYPITTGSLGEPRRPRSLMGPTEEYSRALDTERRPPFKAAILVELDTKQITSGEHTSTPKPHFSALKNVADAAERDGKTNGSEVTEKTGAPE